MKRWIKKALIAVILILNVIIIGRVIISTDKSMFKALTPSAALAQAYAGTESLQVLTGEIPMDVSQNGYLCAYALFYIPEARELQVTVRYNNSAYAYTETSPEEEFLFRLYSMTQEKYYSPEVAAKDSRFMYYYVKLIFTGVDIEEQDHLSIVMGREEKTFDGIDLHYAEQTFEAYKLSGAEARALANYSG